MEVRFCNKNCERFGSQTEPQRFACSCRIMDLASSSHPAVPLNQMAPWEMWIAEKSGISAKSRSTNLILQKWARGHGPRGTPIRPSRDGAMPGPNGAGRLRLWSGFAGLSIAVAPGLAGECKILGVGFVAPCPQLNRLTGWGCCCPPGAPGRLRLSEPESRSGGCSLTVSSVRVKPGSGPWPQAASA